MTNVTIRDVDDRVYREFKAEAIRRGLRLGAAMSVALRQWAETQRAEKTPRKSLLDFEPWGWGEGTERTSEEIDEILYGSKP